MVFSSYHHHFSFFLKLQSQEGIQSLAVPAATYLGYGTNCCFAILLVWMGAGFRSQFVTHTSLHRSTDVISQRGFTQLEPLKHIHVDSRPKHV